MALGFRPPVDALGGITNMTPGMPVDQQPAESPYANIPLGKEDRETLNLREAFIGAPRQQVERLTKATAELPVLEKQSEAERKARQAEREAAAVRKERQTIEESEEFKNLRALEKKAMMSEFVPSQENAKDLSQLFGLITVIGFTIGMGGKRHAMQAMSAMNGMLEGHRLGQEDLYKREKSIFEEQMKTLKQKTEVLQRRLQEITQLAATDRAAAEKDAAALFAQEGADFFKKHAEKYGLIATLELAKANLKNGEEAFKVIQKERELRETREARLQSARLAAQARADAAKDRAASQQELLRMRLGIGVGTSGLVEAFTGVSLPDKEAKPIADAASAIGESRQLQQLVKQTPGIVGREGQMRQFVDRYVKSALSGEPVPTDQQSGIDDERALLFAKRYASYLVNYERSLAPGARGFTVFFQKRFNDLMSPNQFNASGMISLLEDQQREIANQSTKVDRRFNRQNLTEMGDDIASRSLSSNVAPATTPSQSVTVNGKTYTKPANFTDEQWEKYKKDVGGK